MIGLNQYKSKTPVTINTSEEPPLENELISVKEWNHRHGRNFIIFGCTFFVSMTGFVYFLERFENVILEALIFLLVIFAQIAWLVLEHESMKKEMIKPQRGNLK